MNEEKLPVPSEAIPNFRAICQSLDEGYPDVPEELAARANDAPPKYTVIEVVEREVAVYYFCTLQAAQSALRRLFLIFHEKYFSEDEKRLIQDGKAERIEGYDDSFSIGVDDSGLGEAWSNLNSSYNYDSTIREII